MSVRGLYGRKDRKIWNNKKLENTDQPKKTKKLFGKKNDTKKAKTEVKTNIQEYEDIGETKRAVWESKTEKEDSEVIEESETEKENKENKAKTKKRITIKKNNTLNKVFPFFIFLSLSRSAPPISDRHVRHRPASAKRTVLPQRSSRRPRSLHCGIPAPLQ